SEKTRQTGDQGIDFVGTTRLGDLLAHPKKIFRLAHDMQIDFIGQAKHYPNRPLSPSTVRELVGSLELARSRHFSDKNFQLLEDLSLKSFSPVFALLITTGTVTAGARAVAEKSGIIIRSGEQIATYLADLGVGIVQETGDFSDEVFEDWMAGSSH
ncbi:restriction endonuclease, partial [Citromicrobium sp. JL1351]